MAEHETEHCEDLDDAAEYWYNRYKAEVKVRIELNKRIEELEKESTQRGARMQIMREYMTSGEWKLFLDAHPEAADWFDDDGVPVREGE